MRNLIAAKVAYRCHMGEVICALLDALILRDSVVPVTMPKVPTYMKNRTRPWEPQGATLGREGGG